MESAKKNRILYESGVSLGMCDKVRNEWTEDKSDQELIDLWYYNYDFAVTKHYPSNSVLLDCFDRDVLRKNNIIVDDVWSLLNPSQAMILGNSKSNARFNAYHVGQMWIRDTSSVNVYVRDNADVTLCVMDNADVNIYIYGSSANVLVMKYSKDVKVSVNMGSAIIKENFSYLTE